MDSALLVYAPALHVSFAAAVVETWFVVVGSAPTVLDTHPQHLVLAVVDDDVVVVVVAYVCWSGCRCGDLIHHVSRPSRVYGLAMGRPVSSSC